LYTWEDFLDEVKTLGMVPTAQDTFTEARFLRLTWGQMISRILPLVGKVQEGFYEYDFDQSLNATGVYDIPTRAIGSKVVKVALLNGASIYPLTRYYEDSQGDLSAAPAGDYGFKLKRNQVILLPNVPSGWSQVRITVSLRPNRIITNGDAAQVTDINTGTQTVTCETVPSDWVAGSTYDIVQQNPHFDWLSIDQAVAAVTPGAGGTIEFSSALPTRLQVGDWVALAGESPIIQIPEVLHPLLAQYVANVTLKGQGDAEAYKLGVEAAKEIREDVLSLINPRVQTEGKKIVNRTGLLRRGM
jgi:hypothetical protein